MPAINLRDYQLDAVHRMKNGCILCGGVGSGKSRTALAYYYIQQGGKLGPQHVPLRHKPKDLYIITTARKRDTLEWEGELVPFLLDQYKTQVVVDSWNNIKKYAEVKDSFFLFDEQRVVGSGAWVKAFLKIAKSNDWILLSATPGDTWLDYIPVFLANGFYKNRSAFLREHVIFSRFSKFPKVERYVGTGKLLRLRNDILVGMDFQRKTTAHHETVYVDYDAAKYKEASKTRWDPFKEQPMQNAADLCYVWRRLVNADASRAKAVRDIFRKHRKLIVFYNFNYELDILKRIPYGKDVAVAEWNGHVHEPIPDTEAWVYLVQYTAGCEGWNCILTDTMVFYSQNYSYKVMAQAEGRIDRMNTPFSDLYYYHLKSRSGIDLAIGKALAEKKTFNEGGFVKW